jgi:hypothetical protein
MPRIWSSLDFSSFFIDSHVRRRTLLRDYGRAGLRFV